MTTMRARGACVEAVRQAAISVFGGVWLLMDALRFGATV